MNFQNIMQQAQKMQKEMAKKISDFEQKEFDFNYKNGSIKLKINGKLKIINIDINDVLIDPEDKITLQEMIVEAINDATHEVSSQKDNITAASMPKGMPGLF